MKSSNISKQRIMGEAKKLKQQKLPYLNAAPLEDDLYTWHFTFQGPENTDFHEGIYHGQILLPYEYPFKPPDIVFMNKNGRFQTNTKICLTITQYHPEQWNSAWTIRTMLEAVVSLFAENIQGIGALTSSSDIRNFLAKNSHSYVCEKCGPIKDLLPPRPPMESKPAVAQKVEASSNQQEVKVQRKLSQEKKPASELMGLKKNHSQDQRKTAKSQNSSIKRQARSRPQITQRPLEEEDLGQRFGPEIIYIHDRHMIATELTNLTKVVNKIQRNMEQLGKVTSTMRWVS